LQHAFSRRDAALWGPEPPFKRASWQRLGKSTDVRPVYLAERALGVVGTGVQERRRRRMLQRLPPIIAQAPIMTAFELRY